MDNTNHQQEAKRRAGIYLLLVLGVCFALGVLSFFVPDEDGIFVFGILQKGFTAFPVLAALFTRLITKDKSSWNLDFRVWKNKKMLLFSAFMPRAAIVTTIEYKKGSYAKRPTLGDCTLSANILWL